MAEENCKEVNIPTTDNTPLDCPTFILDKCLIVPEGNTFLATNDNDDLEEYHEKLVEKLIVQDQRILVLEGSNPGTISYELTLTGTILNLDVNGSIVSSIDLLSLTTAGLTETKEVFTATTNQTSVTLSNTVNPTVPNQVIVEGIFLNQGIGNDYTISENTVTFLEPMDAGDVIQVFYKY